MACGTEQHRVRWTATRPSSRAIRTSGLWWKSLGSASSASTNITGTDPGIRCRVRTSISFPFRSFSPGRTGIRIG